MKAILCHDFASIDELKYEEVDDPKINSDEVKISVKAIGVNFPDGLLVQGFYQMRPELPFTPGSEISGEISQVGSQVNGFTVGQRVIGLTSLGGYAENIAVPATRVISMPDEMTMQEGAAFVTAHATAHHAFKQRADLKTGETVLVTGASGGTGSAAVQIAKAMGAKVIAACSSDTKCALAEQNGADIVINYAKQDLKETVKSLTQQNGVDVVYECVGGEVFQACTRLIAWGGRLLVIGFASGEIPKFSVNLALVKGYSVVGVYWHTFVKHEPVKFKRNMQELMAWYGQGKITVNIDKTFALKDAVAALDYVANRLVKGKVVLLP